MKKFKKIAALFITVAMLMTILPQTLVFASETTDATLSDIVFGNWAVPGFSPDTTEYSVKVPYIYEPNDFSVPVPEIRVRTTDKNAKAVVTYPASLPGDAIITVTAADGATTKTYTLAMTALGSNKIAKGNMENVVVGAESGNDYGASGAVTLAVSNTSYAGDKSLSITKSGFGYHWPITYVAIPAGKQYISSFMARTADEGHSYTTYPLIYDVEVGESGGKITDSEFYTNNLINTSMTINNTWNRFSAVFRTDELCGVARFSHSYYNWDAEKEVLLDDYYVGELLYDVKITDETGKRKLTIASPDEDLEITLTAEAVNQLGGKQGIKAEDTVSTMKLIGAPNGVTISNGVLTIPAGTEECSFDVSAEVVPTIEYASQSKVIGRFEVNVVGSMDSASLVDIEFDGRGVEGFTPSKTDYTMYVPYRYEENNFDNYPEIEINAVPMDKNAKVTVTYPTDEGEPILIDVVSPDGIAFRQYTVTPVIIGGNMFVDGGFEDTTKNLVTNGSGVFERVTDDVLSGTYAFKYTRNGFARYWFPTKPVANNGKMYILSTSAKLSKEHSADTAYTPDYMMEGFSGTNVLYDNYGNVKSGAGKFATDNWQTTYCTFIPSADWGVDTYYTNWADTVSIVIDEYYVSDIVIADVDVKDTDNLSAKTIKVPESENTVIELNALAKNQFGNTAGVSFDTYTEIKDWAVIGNPDGITVDNGTVTVSPDAKPGVYKIQANVGPKAAYASNFTQSTANGRFTLTVLPAKEGGSFTYKINGEAAEEIAAGEVTCEYTYAYNGGAERKVTFITALYKVENAVEKVVKAEKGATFTMLNPEVVTDTYSITVPSDGTYKIRTFVWDMDTLVPFVTAYGKLE